ncbi:P27 family predicted phage terminase small subunit [Paraburkholderia youngii]|uniref:phage terminase small subunit P27 family n=1 Tax=Paraburkholderia youngii TaxID=2782701 RepID=UPI003D1B594B
MGDKPKSPDLKAIDGSKRKVRALHPAQPDRAMPDPPDHMNGAALNEWHRASAELFELGLLSRVDRAAFAAYCEAWSRYVTARETLDAMAREDPVNNGLLIRNGNGAWAKNPLVSIIADAMRDVMKFAGEFGMSPASRTRIEAISAGSPNHARAKAISQKYGL